MSSVEAPSEGLDSHGRSPIACPRCGAEVAGEQSWCVECGLAVRTRIAPVPNWRAPLIAAAAIGVAAIVALVVAFVVITGDNAPVPAVPVTSTAAQAAGEGPATTQTTTLPPTATAPATTETTPVPTTPATPAPTAATPTAP